MRVECEGGTAPGLAGILAAPSVQGHRLPLPQELGPFSFVSPHPPKPPIAGNQASLARLSL